MRLAAQPKPDTRPIKLTFTREDARKLAQAVISDKLAGGRETMLAVMVKAILDEESPK